MKIAPEEIEITCHLTIVGKKMVRSEGCERIDWLRANYLVQLAINKEMWLILYQDPEDKRYWELHYKHPEMQGGGVPILSNISEKDAKEKYGV